MSDLIAPATLDAFLELIARPTVCRFDLNMPAVRTGCGRSTRFAPVWEWVDDTGPQNDPAHRSRMWTLDGFGRWTCVERSGWDAKARSYRTVIQGEGCIGYLSPSKRAKVEEACRKRVEGWHVYRPGAWNGLECWNPHPWA
jgi:hypothetical protein